MIFATRYADSAVDYLIYLIFTLVAVCIALCFCMRSHTGLLQSGTVIIPQNIRVDCRSIR